MTWMVPLIGLLLAGRAAAATGDDVGVLERLGVPAVPAGDRTDGHATGPQASTEAIAVPTPTAAGSGLAVMGGLMLWRAGRRVVGRA